MADQPSIFGNDNQQPATQPNANPAGSNPAGAQPDANQVATLLSSILNERGEQKYSTIEAALEGLRNAQEFIPNLRTQLTEREREIERLRVEAERAAELERTLAALSTQPPQVPNTPAPVLDESVVAEQVNRLLTQREKQAQAQANLTTVVETFRTQFGTDAEAKFYGKASELGMSKEEVNALAAKSPKAVLTMLGVTQQSAPKPNQPLINTGSFNSAAHTPNAQTYIGRNPNGVIVGATNQDIQMSMDRAKKMVEELHAQGKEVHDLTNPKVYFKLFNQ